MDHTNYTSRFADADVGASVAVTRPVPQLYALCNDLGGKTILPLHPKAITPTQLRKRGVCRKSRHHHCIPPCSSPCILLPVVEGRQLSDQERELVGRVPSTPKLTQRSENMPWPTLWALLIRCETHTVNARNSSIGICHTPATTPACPAHGTTSRGSATPTVTRAPVQAETKGHATGGQTEEHQRAGTCGAADVADLPLDGTEGVAVDLLRDHRQAAVIRQAADSSIGPACPVQRRLCGISR
jgi:hypothetical protein